jgi:hypothetical protein
MEERITHAAGGAVPEYMPKDRLIHLIKNAGRIPVERSSDYRMIGEYWDMHSRRALISFALRRKKKDYLRWCAR